MIAEWASVLLAENDVPQESFQVVFVPNDQPCPSRLEKQLHRLQPLPILLKGMDVGVVKKAENLHSLLLQPFHRVDRAVGTADVEKNSPHPELSLFLESFGSRVDFIREVPGLSRREIDEPEPFDFLRHDGRLLWIGLVLFRAKFLNPKIS
jgi:hypothetical protein